MDRIGIFKYHILSSLMCIGVKCAPEFHNDFWQKNYFDFTRIISQELIIASLFIIKAILNPFSSTFHIYSAQGIFKLHFQCKKVHTILDKTQYFFHFQLFWHRMGFEIQFMQLQRMVLFPSL